MRPAVPARSIGDAALPGRELRGFMTNSPRNSLAVAYALKKKAAARGGCMAEGGPVETTDEQHPLADDGMVERIMKRRQPEGSAEGEEVANADHGENEEGLAGFSPNEFDDLALRDDLEFEYTAENSGDEVGNDRTEHDQEDDVSRIMRKRKAQRNPDPA